MQRSEHRNAVEDCIANPPCPEDTPTPALPLEVEPYEITSSAAPRHMLDSREIAQAEHMIMLAVQAGPQPVALRSSGGRRRRRCAAPVVPIDKRLHKVATQLRESVYHGSFKN